MRSAPDIPIPARIIALMQERNRLFAYSLNRLAGEIRELGFRCSQCGMCCTRALNSHVFLLERDVENLRKIDPDALEPAQDPEFCDQNGTMYVSGYSVRMGDGSTGSCRFLEGKRCRIYERRFSACRIYPYMLRRIPDSSGRMTWRQFSPQHRFGDCQAVLPDEECFTIAREIREYENAYLTQQISFLEAIHEFFTIHNLRQDLEIYRDRAWADPMHGPVTVMVYHAGEFAAYSRQIPVGSEGPCLPGYQTGKGPDTCAGSAGWLFGNRGC